MNISEILNSLDTTPYTIKSLGGLKVRVKKIKLKDNKKLEEFQNSNDIVAMMHYVLNTFFLYEDGSPIVISMENIGEMTVEQIKEINKAFAEANKVDIEEAKKN